MGSSSEPSYLGNPISSTDKLLGHVSFMEKVFKIFKSQPYSACHLTGTEKMLKLKQHTIFAIVNIEKSEYTKFEATVSRNSLYHNRPSDRVRKKINNYAGIFRHIMQKNMLITRKTRWIMRKSKQYYNIDNCVFPQFFLLSKLLSDVPSSSSSL